MNIPPGAEAIITARKQGLKPSNPLVVLVGDNRRLDYLPVVRPVPGRKYDWIWIHGIETYLVGSSEVIKTELIEELAKRVVTPLLNYYFTNEGEGGYCSYLPNIYTIDLPKHQWKWQLEMQPWLECQSHDFSAWLDETTAKEEQVAAH
jgi:hypothetical protein